MWVSFFRAAKRLQNHPAFMFAWEENISNVNSTADCCLETRAGAGLKASWAAVGASGYSFVLASGQILVFMCRLLRV